MKKITFFIGILAIMMPVILISFITYLEMQNYNQIVDYKIVDRSYGEPTMIYRTTIDETVVVRGRITSHSFEFIEWNNNSSKARIIVQPGREVKRRDVLGYVGNKEILASVDGIVEDINIYDNYIKLLNLEKLILESTIKINEVNKLELNKSYELGENVKLKLIFISNVMEGDGRKVYFEVEEGEFFFGQNIEFEIPTGVSYKDVLVVNKNCVYQKDVNGPYFIRRVNSNGVVIGEVKVEVGISNKDLITIVGVEEGWFADPGYAQLMNINSGDGQ